MLAIRNYSTQTPWRTVKTTVFWGDTGTGKTKRVYEEQKFEDVYKLDVSNTGVWWNGYTGQKVLLIDDFYGWIRYGQLLNILDGYPLRLDIKGDFTIAKFERVYITSNEHPNMWYAKKWKEGHALGEECPPMKPALRRRLSQIVKFTRFMEQSHARHNLEPDDYDFEDYMRDCKREAEDIIDPVEDQRKAQAQMKSNLGWNMDEVNEEAEEKIDIM